MTRLFAAHVASVSGYPRTTRGPALVEEQTVSAIRPEAWADWAARQAPSPRQPAPVRPLEIQSNGRRRLTIVKKIAARISA